MEETMGNMTIGATVFAGLAMVAGAAVAKPGSTVTAAADLKWSDVPGFPGVHMAAAEGDPGKAPSHFFLKFDKGFAAPEHHHNADHYGTVVAGTLVLTVDGKESKLGPGSYFSFTGKKPHATKCDAAADCVLQIDARGKWDVIPEKAAPDVKKPADAKPAAK
jgi:quercetin dioxygenase-like cupin family protein